MFLPRVSVAGSIVVLACLISSTTAFFTGSIASRRSTTFIASTAEQQQEQSTTKTSHNLEGRAIDGPVKPVNNFILVKVAKSEDQSSGGIILTAKGKPKKTEGTVIACGPGRAHPESGILLTVPVKPGDGVVYGKYDGTEVDYDGEKHSLIRDDDILVKYGSGKTLTLDDVEVLNDNVLIYSETKDGEETTGGLLIAASSSGKKKPSTGVVAKVGPGRRTMTGNVSAMDVSIGDMVKFRDFAGNEVKIEDKEYTVVRMPDILAKF